MPLLLRALVKLVQNWRFILAFAGLVVVTKFDFGDFLGQFAQAAKELWWIVALACIVIIMREYVRGYFELKKEQMRQNGK